MGGRAALTLCRTLHRSDPQSAPLGPAQEVDAYGAIDLFCVEPPHQVGDAGHRLVVERNDDIAAEQTGLSRRAALVDLDKLGPGRLYEPEFSAQCAAEYPSSPPRRR